VLGEPFHLHQPQPHVIESCQVCKEIEVLEDKSDLLANLVDIGTCGLVISVSSRKMRPRSGSVSLLMQRKSVLLPVPDGPMIANASPWRTVNETPFKISSFP
jgi:hypothetical protein